MGAKITPDKMSFAVVGCGSIGSRHIQVLECEPLAKISAICDIDNKICKEYSDLLRIPTFSSYCEMLKSIHADVIDICTPSHLHAPMAIQALNENFHVLVEKPMALSTFDANNMLQIAEEKSKKLIVVFQNRYNKPVSRAREVIANNRLGEILQIECSVYWNRSQNYYDSSSWRGKKDLEGGTLFTQISHYIDIILWLFGDITWVSSCLENKNHRIEFEDSGIVIAKLESGALVSINFSTCLYKENFEGSIIIIGTEGTIKLGGKYLNHIDYWNIKGDNQPTNTEYTDKQYTYNIPNGSETYTGSSSNHHIVIKEVIKHISSGVGFIANGYSGKKVTEAIEAMYESQANDGKRIFIS